MQNLSGWKDWNRKERSELREAAPTGAAEERSPLSFFPGGEAEKAKKLEKTNTTRRRK